MDAEVVIIGGGVTGLSAAHFLSKSIATNAILTLEANSFPGGTTGSDYHDGYVLDWGSNGFLDREPLTLTWVEDLGLTDAVIKANAAAAKRYIYRNGHLFQVKPPPAFFASRLLTTPGKLRLCCEPFIPPKKDERPESIYEFAARRIGNEAAQILVSAMVLGIYGGDAKQLSIAHCFPRMVQLERAYGGLFKALMAIRKKRHASPMGPPGTLTTFKGGIGTLPVRAAERLGNRIHLNAPVAKLSKKRDGYSILLQDGETVSCRAVLIAIPAYSASVIVQEALPKVSLALKDIPYADISVVCLGYPRTAIGHSLDGFGFLVPRGQSLRLLGCIWTSSLFPDQAPQHSVLLRVMIGGAVDPDAHLLTDEQLINLAIKELTPVLDIQDVPTLTKVFRHPRGIPQYVLGHEKRLTIVHQAEAENPGLMFAGNAYEGIGLNDCVVSAYRATESIVKYLGRD